MEANSERPVSDELRERIVRFLRGRVDGKKMIGVEIGTAPGEVVHVTAEGRVPVRLTEDDLFVIFRMPSGTRDQAVIKEELLGVLARQEESLRGL